MNETRDQSPIELRADIWLWSARFYKTRGVAKQAIDGGKVDLNGAGCKPAKTLRVGDRITISRAEERLEVEVLELSSRRGPASVAQALYRESEASCNAREAKKEQRRLTGAAFDHPQKRPDKQARRQLRQLKDSQ